MNDLFKKRDTVTFDNGRCLFRAILRTVHRDGTLTLECQWVIGSDGYLVSCYDGTVYRRVDRRQVALGCVANHRVRA